ncbi:hypothetical protein CTheo_8472 [Ceratobasidium theobromae]|uniref:Uncharacterized protein n=1 Tax=Ceratobasidium theobromae TaxID=1582974 RepID=A0A5N5Q9K9_9AGAM|nr:hypothetical protein CTheo_8472 [Ceratobasidium theobromae]
MIEQIQIKQWYELVDASNGQSKRHIKARPVLKFRQLPAQTECSSIDVVGHKGALPVGLDDEIGDDWLGATPRQRADSQNTEDSEIKIASHGHLDLVDLDAPTLADMLSDKLNLKDNENGHSLTEATTWLANDIGFLDHVIGKLSTGSRTAGGIITTALADDDDPERIAGDAVHVLNSFGRSSDELRRVDMENPGTDWARQWEGQYAANSDDHGLREHTQKMSQNFLDVSDGVTGIHGAFSQYAIQKGAAYKQDQESLQRQIKNLQDRIAVEQSEAAKAQRTLDGILAGLTMVGSIFETIFTFGQSNKLMKQAVELLERHTRAAAELRRQKDDVARKAEALAREESRLYNVRVVLSTLTHDVVDITSRVGRFANLWAAAHSDFLELAYWIENDYDDELDFLLQKKIEALNSAARVFANDMKSRKEEVVILTAVRKSTRQVPDSSEHSEVHVFREKWRLPI